MTAAERESLIRQMSGSIAAGLMLDEERKVRDLASAKAICENNGFTIVDNRRPNYNYGNYGGIDIDSIVQRARSLAERAVNLIDQAEREAEARRPRGIDDP